MAIDFGFELSHKALWVDVKRQGLLDTELQEPQILYFYTHICFYNELNMRSVNVFKLFIFCFDLTNNFERN